MELELATLLLVLDALGAGGEVEVEGEVLPVEL
jgi:hypothetical protein